MNTFCPFVSGECQENCVFRIHKVTADSETLTVCRLVSSAATSDDLCDILIKEKQNANLTKSGK